VSDADRDHKPSPPPTEVFVPILDQLNDLPRRRPNVSLAELWTEWLDKVLNNRIRVQNDAGILVSPHEFKKKGRYGLNADKTAIIRAREGQPSERVASKASQYDYACEFPLPGSRLPTGLHPILLDYFALVCAAQERGKKWPGEEEDARWWKDKRGLARDQVRFLRDVLRADELKEGGRPTG
jgi:hypothetical protein